MKSTRYLRPRPRLPILSLALSVCAAASAAEFPDGATTPGAAEINEAIGGKVFDVKLASGVTWRLEYKANGWFFVNTSNGFNGSGEWRAEDGKLCSALRGNAVACNDVRLHDGALNLRRDSGEVIRLVAR